ncbi:GNAT family N-acetyltransferase [Yoonia sp. R2331]|uniref:GNAT family N-acetyltransferase n=1 Tax=Yoonia sp. R2331 TaxID=3237238 RepID=UPI0034E44331
MLNPITLAPLDDAHHNALRAVTVKPFQVVFSGQPAEALDTPEDTADIHVILHKGDVIGMFKVDRAYHIAHTFAPADSIGIRAMIIDQDRQGAGFGAAACRLMPHYLPPLYPLKTAAYLTVNTRNAGAYKSYLKGGWTDTGTQHMLGLAGPQHILRLPLV